MDLSAPPHVANPPQTGRFANPRPAACKTLCSLDLIRGFRYADLPFYLAHYRNENGYLRYDILNAQGQVQLANLSLVDYLGGGVVATTQ